MSTFRDKFIDIFGRDFPGHAVELAIPRLRFELAVGKGMEERLEVAESRAKAIIQTVFDHNSTIWLELTFWPTASSTSPEKQMEILAQEGLIPMQPSSWEREVVSRAESSETSTVERWSAPVSAGSVGLDAVLRAVVWEDHGGWQGLSFSVLTLDVMNAVGVFPYDNRGLDVFAIRADTLIPIYCRLTEWILDYDRPRIESELGI